MPGQIIFVRQERSDTAKLQDALAAVHYLQLRGVRPFLSDKYDITQHPNYKYTSDYDKKYTFDIEKYLNRRMKLKADDEYDVIEA